MHPNHFQSAWLNMWNQFSDMFLMDEISIWTKHYMLHLFAKCFKAIDFRNSPWIQLFFSSFCSIADFFICKCVNLCMSTIYLPFQQQTCFIRQTCGSFIGWISNLCIIYGILGGNWTMRDGAGLKRSSAWKLACCVSYSAHHDWL